MLSEHKCFYTILITLIIAYYINLNIKISPIVGAIILPLIIFIILIFIIDNLSIH